MQLLGVLAHVQMDRDAVEALLQPTDTIDRHVHEIQQLVKEVEDLEYALDSSGRGVKSLEEIQLELNFLQRTRYSIGFHYINAISYFGKMFVVPSSKNNLAVHLIIVLGK